MVSKISLMSFATVLLFFPHVVAADGYICTAGIGAPFQEDCFNAASALLSDLRLCEGYVLIPAGTAAHPGHSDTVGTYEVWIAATGG
jgi:hypothetical protein